MPVFRLEPLRFFWMGASAAFCAWAAVRLHRPPRTRPVGRAVLAWALALYLLLVVSFSLFPVRFDPSAGVVERNWKTGVALLPAAGLDIRLFALLPLGLLLPQAGRVFRKLLPCLLAALLFSLLLEAVRLAEYVAGLANGVCCIGRALLLTAGALPGFGLRRLMESRKNAGLWEHIFPSHRVSNRFTRLQTKNAHRRAPHED